MGFFTPEVDRPAKRLVIFVRNSRWFGTVAPTRRAFAIHMCTVGIWNHQGRMDEEFLFWDNQIFYQQIGLS